MIGLAGCIVCVLLLQAAFFVRIWNSSSSLHKADLIVVFPGDQERIVEGHALAKAGYADNLLVIGQTEKSFAKLVQKLGALPAVNLLPNSKSRSTFEDVNIARQIIFEKRLKSVILVTSSYHMPRVLFLLKASLLDADFKVDLQYYPVSIRDHSKAKRLYFNELIKFWGSTVEMIGYRITEDLLRDSPFFVKVRQFVKNRLLFQI